MTPADTSLYGLDDPRLALHASRATPAWLWSSDGSRILWANPVGARALGAANAAALTAQPPGPADPNRRQIIQLAHRLPAGGATRLERLRGFGSPLRTLLTCAVARLDFANGSDGILVVAMEPVGRAMPLVERLQALVEGVPTPIAAFGPDGLFVGASQTARTLLGFRNLSEAGLDAARRGALTTGRSETPVGDSRVVLQRIGEGADVALVALLAAGRGAQPTAAPRSERINIAPQAIAAAAPDAPRADAEPPPAAADPSRDDAAKPTTAAPAPSPTVSPDDKPLRFIWDLDATGTFDIGSPQFRARAGQSTLAHLARPWPDLAASLGLDRDGRFSTAIAARRPFSGVRLSWPVDGATAPLDVDFAGVPVWRDGAFAGFRGFGIAHFTTTPAEPAEIAETSDDEVDPPRLPQPLSAATTPVSDRPMETETDPPDAPASDAEPHAATPPEQTSLQANLETPVDTLKNVLPFRPATEPRSPSLTAIESNAFDELARRLSEELDTELEPEPADAAPVVAVTSEPEPAVATDWLSPPVAPARGESVRDRALLDLLPVGVLIYRLDRLLYANPAFLARVGHDTLRALEEAGGLDALYVETTNGVASDTSEAGSPITLSAAPSPQDEPAHAPIVGRLHTVDWNHEPAHALIFAPEQPPAVISAEPDATETAAGHAHAEDLAAILDTTADGIVMFDESGRITACNRSAEALFGQSGEAMTARTLPDLFAPESAGAVLNAFDSVKSGGVFDHGREVLGKVAGGGMVPLSAIIGRTRPAGPNYFAVFRDLSPARKTEASLAAARRQADAAANAKADVLARISHELRAPVNAIIGFADVMIEERFGALGTDRYRDYLKDIRASGKQVLAIVGDRLDLSRIETGKLQLALTEQNLNETAEKCVAGMQAEANRERIVIRTSLSHGLPAVQADANALRQIICNVVAISIHLANAGGQVIVSTAQSDVGDVMLRVRDTGHRLNGDEVAAALEPYGAPAPINRFADASGVSLSLTKALAEANGARFQIRTGAQAGTLIEVVFARAMAAASQ